MKNKLIIMSAIGLVGMGTIGSSVTAFADDLTSTVSGKITSGALSMSTPNNFSFDIQLTGEQQLVELDEAQHVMTKVSDFRGTLEGWEISVKSPDFATYADNFQVVISNNEVTSDALIVKKATEDEAKELTADVTLNTAIKVMEKAKAGNEYVANLEWNVQQPSTFIAE